MLANGTSTRSVIYTSYLYQGRPNPCSDSVAQWLLRVKGKGSGDIEGVGKNCESSCEEDKIGKDGGNSGGTIDVASGSGVNSADGTTNGSSSSGISKDKENRVVRRLVVGHQPHADAPLVLQVHGIQVPFTSLLFSCIPSYTFFYSHRNCRMSYYYDLFPSFLLL